MQGMRTQLTTSRHLLAHCLRPIGEQGKVWSCSWSRAGPSEGCWWLPLTNWPVKNMPQVQGTRSFLSVTPPILSEGATDTAERPTFASLPLLKQRHIRYVYKFQLIHIYPLENSFPSLLVSFTHTSVILS